MRPFLAKSPALTCWLLARLTTGSPEHPDHNAGSSVEAQATTLSISAASECKAQSTETVFITLNPASQNAPASFLPGASIATTTIIVSPIQSHAKTDVTADGITADTSLTYGSTTGFSSNIETGNPASDIYFLEYSTVSRTTRSTILSTHTVTFTIVPAGKNIPSSTTAVVSNIKGPAMSSGVAEPTASSIASCITHTVIGPDGRPTVVESIFITASPVQTTVAEASRVWDTNLPAQTTAAGVPVPSYGSSSISGLPIHASFTVIGADGSSSVIDTTWIIPVPPTSVMTGLNPLPSVFITSDRLVSGRPTNPLSGVQTIAPITSLMGAPTCTTITIMGSDLRPTATELTIIAPTGAFVPISSILAPPSFVPAPSMTDLASQPAITSNSAVSTLTWKVIGADGTVSPIVQTITAPLDSLISGIPLSLPTAVTSNIPLPTASRVAGTVPRLPAYSTFATELVQNSPSIISLVSGVGSIPTFVPPPSWSQAPAAAGEPAAYSIDSVFPPISSGTPLPDRISSSEGDWISSILYGSLPTPSLPDTPTTQTPLPGTPTPTEFVPIPIPNPVSPAPLETVTTVSTSTWTNVIPEQTTTYVMKFPHTTLATVTIPRAPLGRRLLRRQSSVGTMFPWSNSTTSPSPLTENTALISSLSSHLVTPAATPTPPTVTIPTIPVNTAAPIDTPLPINTPTASPEPLPSVCAAGGKIGNTTVDFDNLLPGPVLNPAGDLWFSEGFLIAPPSSPPSDAYIPSSGNHLIEFLPPVLVPSVPFDGASDTAEISIGPNEVYPCFRFNFYGANLGCAAEGVEQWCEFEFSAYTYNSTTASEASMSWSETRRVPACPNFPHGPCPLVPVQLDGYNDATSILITARVGLELRAWWGDDFQIGWTDNSCEASACRTDAIPRRVRREVLSRAARRGVWQWGPNGARKLDDDYIWSSFE